MSEFGYGMIAMAVILAGIDYITTRCAKLAGVFMSEWVKPRSKSKWHALPGNRLELGDTGYFIEMTADKTRPFTAYGPEGGWICKGNDLVGIKKSVEANAEARRELMSAKGQTFDFKKGGAA